MTVSYERAKLCYTISIIWSVVRNHENLSLHLWFDKLTTNGSVKLKGHSQSVRTEPVEEQSAGMSLIPTKGALRS